DPIMVSDYKYMFWRGETEFHCGGYRGICLNLPLFRSLETKFVVVCAATFVVLAVTCAFNRDCQQRCRSSSWRLR
ncbi:hypothetical protein L195_g063903, partial [Trifolium pratense]